jgi:hypothetical protein
VKMVSLIEIDDSLKIRELKMIKQQCNTNVVSFGEDIVPQNWPVCWDKTL